MKTTRQALEKQRTLIYNLQHQWKIADLIGSKTAREKAAKKLIAAERKLDRMLGLPYRSYISEAFVKRGLEL